MGTACDFPNLTRWTSLARVVIALRDLHLSPIPIYFKDLPHVRIQFGRIGYCSGPANPVAVEVGMYQFDGNVIIM